MLWTPKLGPKIKVLAVLMMPVPLILWPLFVGEWIAPLIYPSN